jgi:hypothetical protein
MRKWLYRLGVLGLVGMLVLVVKARCGQPSRAHNLAHPEARLLIAAGMDRPDCQIAGATSGMSSVAPPFEARCGAAPDGKCRVSDDPQEPWEYRWPVDDPAWRYWVDELRWPPETYGNTFFHKRFSWELRDRTCWYTATLYGDFDDDGNYSTFEYRTGYRAHTAEEIARTDRLVSRSEAFPYDIEESWHAVEDD